MSLSPSSSLAHSHSPGQRKRQSRTGAAKDGSREGSASKETEVELPSSIEPSNSLDISPLSAVSSSNAPDLLLSLELLGTLEPQWLMETPETPSASFQMAGDPLGDPLSPGFLPSIESSLSQDIFSGDQALVVDAVNVESEDSVDDGSWFTGFSPSLSPSSGSHSNRESTTSFPDSYLLPMSELTLIRAMLRVAGRINAQSVWELTANSPFNLGTSPPPDQLPATWQPTATQLIMPHHPIIDLLPWPAARDRVINVLSLPDEARPPAARGSLAVCNFAYDIEDGAEGIRVWGSDPYDETCWEVGQLAFAKWWFIFDRAVIERSNYWRRLRGAPPLRMESPGESRVSEL